MNRFDAITLLCIVSFISCSKETTATFRKEGKTDTCNQVPIMFGCNEGLTRSFVETTEYSLEEHGFKVAGIASTGETIFQDNTVWDESKQCFKTAGQEYFFPSDKSVTLDFHAVYPSESELTIQNGSASILYSLNTESDLVASSRYAIWDTSAPIPLVFDHILSRVSFTLSGMERNVCYEVSELSVSFPTQGKYSFESGEWTDLVGEDVMNIVTDTVHLSNNQKIHPEMSLSVLPYQIKINVKWTTFRNGLPAANYARNIFITPIMGKDCLINLYLPDDQAEEITFNIAITPWGQENTNITLL